MLVEGLGTLSLLPREIRDKVYGYVLILEPVRTPCPLELLSHGFEDPPPRTSLLQTSRRIHSEAEIVLFQVNEFGIWIDHDRDYSQENESIMGRPGYRVEFGLYSAKCTKLKVCLILPRPEMLRHMRWICLLVGTQAGIKECDIVPTKSQTISGPDRPTFKSLVVVLKEICEGLKGCHQIQCLSVFLRSIEETPGSIEIVIDPIRRLRGIKKTRTAVTAVQDDQWVDWILKRSYERYMNKIMAMPEGIEVPKYVGDEREPNPDMNNIFEIFGHGDSSADDEDDEDDNDDGEDDDDMDEESDETDHDAWEDDEEDGFEMFMNAMSSGNFEEAFDIANGPLGPGLPIPPPLAASFLDTATNVTLVPGYPEVAHMFPTFPHLHNHFHHGTEDEDELVSEDEDTRSEVESLD